MIDFIYNKETTIRLRTKWLVDENDNDNMLMMNELKLSQIKFDSLLKKAEKWSSNIKWTNKFDCPPGYEYNEDGWVETLIAFPKISVCILPHMRNKLGEHNLLLQNLLALRILNDVPHEMLAVALYNRYKQAMFGMAPDKEVFDDVLECSKKIQNYTDLPKFDKSILMMENIWYSQDCTEEGKAQIKQVIRHNYIENIRNMMPINTKYKSDKVREEAAITKYAMNKYWKDENLDKTARTLGAISESIQTLRSQLKDFTDKDIIEMSGVSQRTISRYKEQLQLK